MTRSSRSARIPCWQAILHRRKTSKCPRCRSSDLSVWPEPESKAGGRTGAFLQNQYHSGAAGYWEDTNDPEYHRQCCSQRKTVAVVSNNNSATHNVVEKLEKKNAAFLTAFLAVLPTKRSFWMHRPALSEYERLGNVPGGTTAIRSGNDCTLQRTERNATMPKTALRKSSRSSCS